MLAAVAPVAGISAGADEAGAQADKSRLAAAIRLVRVIRFI